MVQHWGTVGGRRLAKRIGYGPPGRGSRLSRATKCGRERMRANFIYENQPCISKPIADRRHTPCYASRNPREFLLGGASVEALRTPLASLCSDRALSRESAVDSADSRPRCRRVVPELAPGRHPLPRLETRPGIAPAPPRSLRKAPGRSRRSAAAPRTAPVRQFRPNPSPESI